MKPWIGLLTAILLLQTLLISFPLPSRESSKPEQKTSAPDSIPITIEGTLRLVGSEPFTRLALMDSQNRIYYIDADSRDRIRSYIGAPIKIEGILVRRSVRLADNRELPDELSIVQYTWEPLSK